MGRLGSRAHSWIEISELKWTGMGEFNSDDHYIYCCGQESLRRNGVAIMVNNRVRNAVLGCNLKNDRTISVHFQGKPFNIMVIQVYALSSNGEEAEVEQFSEDLGEGNGTPLQYSCLENPMDRRAWWATVHEVTESRTRLSWWLRLCASTAGGTGLSPGQGVRILYAAKPKRNF